MMLLYDDRLNSKILKLAHNTKIYNRGDSVEGIESTGMRVDLRSLVSWSKERQIFNVDKCTQLQEVSEDRNLGMISDDLKLKKTVYCCS